MGMRAPVTSLKLNGDSRGFLDPTDHLISLLESRGFDPRPAGTDNWESRCPAHGGSRHNLSITRGANGAAVIHCHHDPSCQPEAIVQALRLTMGDLFLPDHRENRHAGKNGRTGGTRKTSGKAKDRKTYKTLAEAVEKIGWGMRAASSICWPYQWADGKDAMAVVRFNKADGGKTYLPFHPIKDGWQTGDPRGKLPLFNLPDLVDARRIYFHEGEKAAVLTKKLGVPSTTTAHGAKSPQKTDVSPLAGKEVVIFPDHDQEGEGYADRIVHLLAHVPLDPKPAVKIVRLPLEGEGDDVAEWLEDARSKGWSDDECRAELERLADAAEPIDLDAVLNEAIVSALLPESEKGNAGKGTKKRPQEHGDVGIYFEQDDKLWIVGEEAPEPLANFTARITHNITRHEAGIQSVRYQIRARHQSPAIGVREATVASEKYPSMSWVFALGAEFALAAGRDRKDHARHAIQLLSTQDGIESIVEHTALGWVRHGDAWLYMHAGGAIGDDGPSAAIRVDPPPILSRYRLPDPPTDPEAIRRAVEATFAIWELPRAGTPGARGAAAIVATLPWRAVLSPFDVSCHFGGPSGNLKTSTGRLVLQHFAADVRGRNAPAPAGWNDTKNALQRLAYDCACSVLLIDDLKTNAQLEDAETIFQAQGNLQNRTRMAIDQTLQQPLDPRGTLLSTGEIDPRTASTLGRMLVDEIKAGDIDRGVLSRLQQSGDAGLFALAMSAYIRWLAPRLDEVRAQHERLTAEIRAGLGDIPGAHPRHPDAIAQLIAAYRLFVDCAVKAEAIQTITADSYVAQARQYLVELARLQADSQQDAKAGRQFLDLIAMALGAGHCYLANAHGDTAPREYAGACGWETKWLYQGNDVGQRRDWEIPTNSKQIGFIDEDAGTVYLDPTASVAIANDQARRLHTPQSFASVGRELMNEGLCEIHVEDGVPRATKHKRIPNHGKKRYFWIAIPNLFGEAASTDA
jgi:hypothetical protein